MTEENIKIKSLDDLNIEGIINKCNFKTQKLIIFLQYPPSQQGDCLFESSASFFQEKGFNTFRYDLYRDEQSEEKCTDTTVLKGISTFETVLDYFKDEYSSIHVVSYKSGAQVLACSNSKNIKSCVLWQPTYELSNLELISQSLALFTKPVCIIVPRMSGTSTAEDLYYKNTNCPNQFSTVQCSSFNFNEEDSEKEKELLYITLAWFERY